MKRIGTLLLSIMLIASAFTGCSKAPNTEDAGTSTNAPVTLTMFCSWDPAETKRIADGIHAKLPHITLDYEVCPIGAIPYADEVTRRAMHDAEADIFTTTDTDLWDSGKLLNLTDEDFVSQYNLSIMKTLSGDGSVYFVPGLGDVLCYMYNANWLEEAGLSAPKTQEKLNGVLTAIKNGGKHPFLVPYSQMPTQYVKVLSAGYLSTPNGQQWLSDYNEGKTTMEENENWQKLWNGAEELIENGFLCPEDLAHTENMRITNIRNEEAFMTTISSGQYGKMMADDNKQFQLLPLMGEKPENQMVYTAPTGYFAVSNRLASPDNADKRAAALQVLEFISTAEGQELLRGSNPMAISYLSGTVLPIDDNFANLEEIIKQGAYTKMPTFERGVESVIEEVFGKLIEGKTTAQEALKACDAQNAQYVAHSKATLPVLGTATETFPWTYMKSRTEELAVVDFCMDSVRKAAETDFAFELGTAFRSEIFKGEITAKDVESLIRQEKKLYHVEITGQQIWDLIEQGVILPPGSAWFIAPSGLRYSYQRMEDGFGKLLTVTLDDGTPINLEKTYSVAISENQIMPISGTVNFSESEKQEFPFTLREAVTENIMRQGEITPKTDGRIEVVIK